MNRYIPRKKPDLPKPTQVTSIKVLVESVPNLRKFIVWFGGGDRQTEMQIYEQI